MATPQIPPRPFRSQNQQPSAMPVTNMAAPRIPPRPLANPNTDRSRSPHRESFARSPLNEALNTMNHGNSSGDVYHSNNQNTSTSSLGIQRPPSVSLPSIGQEGNEYGDLEFEGNENYEAISRQSSPTQTRNVGSDLPLHAPKPSLSTSDAKARIATVTRTDSSQAAAVGIGKSRTPVHADDREPHVHNLASKVSFPRTESSASTERPGSALAEVDHGIPEIGQRVPMYPNAGDVQAPSPSPFTQTTPSGIGFHNDGSQKSKRHHGRTRSGREVFSGPPGSYGLHGHGHPHNDQFERAWYEKHPDALLREENGQYGPGLSGGRGEWAMSSDDLNKIVRDTANRGSGFGTSPNVVGLPNEQIGYMASEEYASRMNSPRPQSASYHNKAHSNHSQTHGESPLRKASFPVDPNGKDTFDRSKDLAGEGHHHSEVFESEAEDDDVIHIDAPDVRKSKIGGNGYDPPTEDLGPYGGNTDAEGGWIEERGYGVPILASDEVAKEPGSEFLQPAVSPSQERRGNSYHAGVDADVPLSYQSGFRHGSRSGSAASSRSTSRPVSVHGSLPGLAKFCSIDDREDMHTPLEDVDEYEPLFPEDENKTEKRPSVAERFKHRPDMKKRFPSQDIWEDTPNSLQLQATVSTPDLNEVNSPPAAMAPSTTFELPEAEAARKGEVTETDKAQLIPKEDRWAKSQFKPHVRDAMQRPSIKQRFPSRDIWEDSPDSAHLEATVGDSQVDETLSPPDLGLEAGAVVQTSGRPDDVKVVGDQPQEGATTGSMAVGKPSIPPRPMKTRHVETSQLDGPPSIPARPPQRLHNVPPAEIPPPPSKFSRISPLNGKEIPVAETRDPPMLPERSKPQIPARPVRTTARDTSEGEPLSKTASIASTGSSDLNKTVSATSTGTTEDLLKSSRGITSPPPAPKPKPMLPSRPAGGKIAALKAGFLSDLDKRLQLGPQAPSKSQDKAPEEEKEEEKAPLADARKGRARGPARRKPAASPAAGAESSKQLESKLNLAGPWILWQISTEDDGIVDAVHATKDVLPAQKPSNTQSERLSDTDLQVTTTDEKTPKSEPIVSKVEEISHLVPEKGPEDEQAITLKHTEDAKTTIPNDSTFLDASPSSLPLPRTIDAPSKSVETSESAVQTGEKQIILDPGSSTSSKVTAYDGNMANDEGNIVTTDQIKTNVGKTETV